MFVENMTLLPRTKLFATRLRCARPIKYTCLILITTYLVIQARSLNNYSKIAADDAYLNTTLNRSIFESGSDVKTMADFPRFEPPSRSPIYHVNFLKVHKAGSTTVQNLMFRFGIRHNLTILLPRSGNYFLGRSSPMSLKPGSHYEIFACHTVFSKRVFGLLPEDTVSVAIIRDPLERAISAAYYYRDVFGTAYLKRIPGKNFIENLIDLPKKYDVAAFSYTKNSMGKDFGFSPGMQSSDDRIKAHMDYLQKEFRVVMVMERFEESLVLLRRSLGWSLEDIIFIQSNSHQHKPPNLSQKHRSKFKQTCNLDYAIYDTFYPIFEAKVLEEGPEFQEEVTHFEEVLANVKEFCNTAQTTLVTDLHVPASKWNQPFGVTRRDCELMRKKEIIFINELRVRHSAMQKTS